MIAVLYSTLAPAPAKITTTAKAAQTRLPKDKDHVE
jgi:hypothetical protein